MQRRRAAGNGRATSETKAPKRGRSDDGWHQSVEVAAAAVEEEERQVVVVVAVGWRRSFRRADAAGKQSIRRRCRRRMPYTLVVPDVALRWAHSHWQGVLVRRAEASHSPDSDRER
jgi:hypothetical protein